MHIDTCPAPRIQPEEAAALARRLYGLSVTADPLPGEFDSNFRLTSPEGRRFVLKIMHPIREPIFVDLQCAALATLAERAPELALPRVVPTATGTRVTAIERPEGARLVWMLDFLPGRPLAAIRPHTPELRQSLGELLGRMDRALSEFDHPGARRELKWDLARSGWVGDYLSCVEDPVRRTLAAGCLERYHREVVPALGALRQSVIHNDANDHNVLATGARAEPLRVTSVIDFGDMVHTITVAEPAIAAAYAMLDQPDPLAVVASVVRGYNRALRLTEGEVALLAPLVVTRLMVSVVNSAYRRSIVPDDPYVTISERPAWDALHRWATIPPALAEYTLRAACDYEPVPRSGRVVSWLRARADTLGPVLDTDLRRGPVEVLDLSVGSRFLGADPAHLSPEQLGPAIDRRLAEAGGAIGVGRYDEVRPLYTAGQFAGDDSPVAERRVLHLGLDLFAPAGTPVRAPLPGTIAALADNDRPQDYGPVILLRHEDGSGEAFYTLYGHLSVASLAGRHPGQAVARGETLGTLGDTTVNGGWPPHLHLQLIVDPLGLGTDFPGVAKVGERAVWTSLSPDPNLLLGIPAERFPSAAPSSEETRAARRARLGGSLSLSYRRPLKIVRGWRQYLYDDEGRAYLDVFNNVPLVGHSHPRVVRAIQEQVALLNTNTRYLHDNITAYAERLTALMPDPLRVCYFLNSASEANELALRLARTHTRRWGVVVLEHAYHGNTGSLIEISPYKFDGPGGSGRRPWVHVAPMPDDYRGPYRRGDPDAGRRYAEPVGAILASATDIAAYIAESLPSVGGQIVLPPGYLPAVYRQVRAAGALCIADEVQVGFGRLGTHVWGFETQGVVPDIVVLGKPIGNGFPLAAVVTTPEIARSFDNGMEFFSTFGGNPVACAAGLAVLQVVEEERLQANALRVGGHLLTGLADLMPRFPLVGDVRGSGLFLGVELVRDRTTLEPAGAEAKYVVNRLRDCGVLAGTDGPYDNVLKIRPPLIFSDGDVRLFLDTLAAVLAEDPVA